MSISSTLCLFSKCAILLPNNSGRESMLVTGQDRCIWGIP